MFVCAVKLSLAAFKGLFIVTAKCLLSFNEAWRFHSVFSRDSNYYFFSFSHLSYLDLGDPLETKVYFQR